MCRRQWENGKSFFLVCLRLKVRPKARINKIHEYGDWWRLDGENMVGLYVRSKWGSKRKCYNLGSLAAADASAAVVVVGYFMCAAEWEKNRSF